MAKKGKDEKIEASEQIDKEAYEQKITDLEDQLKRAVADFRNLENRVKEERIEFVKYANKTLLEELLPAFDTLILASRYSEDQNIQVTVKYLLDILQRVGVQRVETVGANFDPATMEAVEVVRGEDGKVIEETQPGFLLNGKILRAAKVKVGGKVEEREESSEGEN